MEESSSSVTCKKEEKRKKEKKLHVETWILNDVDSLADSLQVFV